MVSSTARCLLREASLFSEASCDLTPRSRWFCDSKVERVLPKTFRQTARCFSRLAGLKRRPQSSQGISCISAAETRERQGADSLSTGLFGIRSSTAAFFGCGSNLSSGFVGLFGARLARSCGFGAHAPVESPALPTAAESFSTLPWDSGSSRTCCLRFLSSSIWSLMTRMTRCSSSCESCLALGTSDPWHGSGPVGVL